MVWKTYTLILLIFFFDNLLRISANTLESRFTGRTTGCTRPGFLERKREVPIIQRIIEHELEVQIPLINFIEVIENKAPRPGFEPGIP